MKHLFTALFAAGLSLGTCAAELPASFSDGFLILNEGWFGHDPGSINFIASEGTVYTDIYSKVNKGRTFGNTSCYGQIFGDRMFVVSKQSYGETGGRLVMTDASSLVYQNQMLTLPSGDGRAFCAVNEHKGYLSTSDGIYAVDLDTFTAGTENLSGNTKQCGELLRYGRYVFGAVQNVGVAAIDIESDEMTMLDIPKVMGFVVTADGTLYAATTDTSAEFVSIDPVSLETEAIDIEGSHAIQNGWGTWRKAPLSADIKANKVYYGIGSWSISGIVAYDFDTKEFTPDFVTLPGKATGLEYNQEAYGEGLSIDPASGNLIITAVESGWGSHYEKNWIYFVDTESAEIVRTITPDDYYWFPAAILYPDFSAPSMTLGAMSVDKGIPSEIDLMEATELRVGNPHLVVYEVAVDDEDVAEAEMTAPATLTVNGLKSGSTRLHVTASYQGRSNTYDVDVTVLDRSGVAAIENAPASRDVYSMSGILLIRNADKARIDALAPGMYIIGGKKVVKK